LGGIPFENGHHDSPQRPTLEMIYPVLEMKYKSAFFVNYDVENEVWLIMESVSDRKKLLRDSPILTFTFT